MNDEVKNIDEPVGMSGENDGNMEELGDENLVSSGSSGDTHNDVDIDGSSIMKDYFSKDEQDKINKKLNIEETDKNEMTVKGVNKTFNKKFDIKVTIGSLTFTKITSLTNTVGRDVIFIFKKKGIRMFVMDTGSSHSARVWIDRVEMAEYILAGVDNDEQQKTIYVDMSFLDKLYVDEEYPLDLYIDTIHEKRIYAVCGKDSVHRTLSSKAGETSPTLIKYKDSDRLYDYVMKHKTVQKSVITSLSMKRVFESLSRKVGSKDSETTLVDVLLKRNSIMFYVEDVLSGYDTELSNDDVLVYPMREDNETYNLKFFLKFKELKFSYQCGMFLGKGMPVVFEARLGAGKINVQFLLAPRAKISE